MMLAVSMPLPMLAKPPAASVTESAHLRRAKATVDKLTTQLTAMVKRAEAPGMDVAKVQSLVQEFQANVASQRAESDAIEKLLSDDEKAQVGRYIAERVAPLLARFEAVYKRVQDEADPHREERQKAILADLDALGQQADAAVALAKNAGKDEALRAAAVQKLEGVEVDAHALYHRGIVEVPAANAREQWDGLYGSRIERQLQRAERLLRMGLQAVSAEYLKAKQTMGELTTQADALHGEWLAVQDWTALKASQARETVLQAAVQNVAQDWRLLAPDEAAELDFSARETLVPAIERLTQDSAEARKRLPPEPQK